MRQRKTNGNGKGNGRAEGPDPRALLLARGLGRIRTSGLTPCQAACSSTA
jgi:hypothetical protein